MNVEEDVTRIKNLLAKYVPLVKELQQKVSSLDAQVLVLKNSHTVDTLLGQRFVASSQDNRAIRIDPKRLAYVGYLIYQKKASQNAIARANLMSLSQVQGFVKWDHQHTEDYMTIQGLQGVFRNGLPVDEIKELGEDIDLEPIKNYLPITTKEHENEQRVI